MAKGSINRGSSILRVKGVYDSLKSAEKRIADYLLEYPEDVVNSTIEELTVKTDSSYATISRFCKKIGFSGFKEFRNKLVNDLASNLHVSMEDYMKDFTVGANTTIKDICEMVYEYSTKSIEHTALMVDPQVIGQVAERILNAGFIYFVGAGTSNVCAHYAYTKFFRLGFSCQYESDSTLLRMRASIMKENDILFAISSSGRTQSIVDAARIARENGAFLISISDFAISPLTKISDLNLYTTPRNTSMFMEFEMPLIQGQISIIDILFSCCSAKLSKEGMELYDKTRNAALKEKVRG